MQQTKSINILMVEDDSDIINLLHLHFSNGPYIMINCNRGKEAIDLLETTTFSLIILDIMLPDIDGLEICRAIREKKLNIPIIMLTSRADEIDKVLALELGADDYVTKPFSIRELQARVKAVLRRSQHFSDENLDTSQEIWIKDLYISKEKKLVTLSGKRLELTAKEFDLLFLLASHVGQTFSRKQLLEHIWGYAFSGYEHTVTSHINRLRLKIEKDLQHPHYILTTWGSGYRFAE
jgi:two-component system, OmpR family, alkaline phosphatase synthesis response regulator PhoP